ncbi:MAG TPA: response regulator [Planctomycetota bacterium]|nr:response regulator [Planctomycetota bacterium]
MSGPDAKPLILVADDDANLRRILGLFLAQAGYATLEAADGREALDLALRHRPDAAILDVMMPYLDGFDVCRKIKEHAETRRTPVLMCSAKNRKEDLLEALRSGAEDYILKPFTKEIVLGKIRKALAARRAPPPRETSDRRDARRRVSGWSVSWGAHPHEGLAAVYKTRVHDISLKGFSFEFSRCDLCTGYEQSTVHPLCLFARHARRFRESQTLEFVLAAPPDVVVEVEGRIAHVYQWPTPPHTEKVGVVLTRVTAEAQRLLQAHLEGAPA